MCGCEDGESPEFCRWTKPRARKEHECRECRRTIAVGERYELIVGKWDGEFDSLRTCLRCEAVRDAFAEVEGCHPPIGTLREEIHECIWLNGLQREFGAALRKRLGKSALKEAA